MIINAIFCVLHDTTVVNDQHSCIKRNFWEKIFQNFVNTQRMNNGITFIIHTHNFDKSFQKQTFTITCKNRYPWMTNSLR